MRPRRTGTLAFISSSSAWTPLPFMSVYAASKAGLSAYVEALHKGIRPLGLRAVAVELGGFLLRCRIRGRGGRLRRRRR